MATRLIDVMNKNGEVIHTYPVTISEPEDASEADYEAKALEAAAHGRLVPDTELKSLTVRRHIDRRGRMEPFGDDIAANSETKLGLEHAVRERAYFLWELEGCPQGQEDEYWQRARNEHLRERAYVLWQQEGSPKGRAEEYWRRTCDFEAQ